MSDPIATKEVQRGLGKRHVSILGSFSAVHMDQHATAVDIGDFQVETLVKSEATGVYGAMVCQIVKCFDASEKSVDLFAT